MTDLEKNLQKTKKWIEKTRVMESIARVSISGERLVFFSFQPGAEVKAGNVATILDLSHASSTSVEKDLERSLLHIEQIAKNILTNTLGEKNGGRNDSSD